MLTIAYMLLAHNAYAAESNAVVSEVKDPIIIEDIRNATERDLRLFGSNAHVVSCDHAFDFVMPAPTGHDSSYGARCTIQTNSKTFDVRICNDWMVGKFTMTWSGDLSREWFSRFIETNCPPGG
jgi:hypothetical protein